MNLPFTGIFNKHSASCFQDSVHNDYYNRGTLQTKITRTVKKGRQEVGKATEQFKEAIREEGSKLQSRLNDNLAYQPSAEIVTAVVSNAVATPHLFRGIVDTVTENVRQGDPLFYTLPKRMEAEYIPNYRERMEQKDIKAFTEAVLNKVPASFQFGRKAQASTPSYPTVIPSPTEHEKRADEPPALPSKPKGGWTLTPYQIDIATNSISEINRRDGNFEVDSLSSSSPPALPKKYVRDPALSEEQHQRNLYESFSLIHRANLNDGYSTTTSASTSPITTPTHSSPALTAIDYAPTVSGYSSPDLNASYANSLGGFSNISSPTLSSYLGEQSFSSYAVRSPQSSYVHPNAELMFPMSAPMEQAPLSESYLSQASPSSYSFSPSMAPSSTASMSIIRESEIPHLSLLHSTDTNRK